jgi:sulfur carrier protein
MILTINGKKEELENIEKLGDLLHALKINDEEKGFAVAINEEVIFRNVWQHAFLSNGDRVEIIHATQGG